MISTINTPALASIAVVTKLRFIKALSSATAVPTAAEIICPEENMIAGKVIADNTAYGI